MSGNDSIAENQAPENAEDEWMDEEAPSILREFIWFLGENKKWWLIPLIVVFVLLAAIFIIAAVTGSTALAPFLYSFL